MTHLSTSLLGLLCLVQKIPPTKQEERFMCFSCATPYFRNATAAGGSGEPAHISDACAYNPVAYHMPIATCPRRQYEYCYSMAVHKFELSWWRRLLRWFNGAVGRGDTGDLPFVGAARGCWPETGGDASMAQMRAGSLVDAWEESGHWCSVRVIWDHFGLPVARIKWCFCHRSLCNRRCFDPSVEKCFALNTTTAAPPTSTSSPPNITMATLVPANYTMEPIYPAYNVAASCLEWYSYGYKSDGLYNVSVTLEAGGGSTEAEILEVYCDMASPGGGWMVFQRRQGDTISFDRNWRDYENGFGTVDGESDFWLGLKYLRAVTASHKHYLLVDMRKCDGVTGRQLYNHFEVGNAASGYRLSLTDLPSTGSGGDSLRYERAANGTNGTVDDQWNLDGMRFRTYDRDNYWMCAHALGGGWWYNSCTMAFLNGRKHNCTESTGRPVHTLFWKTFSDDIRVSLQKGEMKVRPRLPCHGQCFTVD